MHILNNESKGTKRYYRKHSGRIRKTQGTGSREQEQKLGFLGVEDKKMHGEGGWFLVRFWDHRCLSFTGMRGHMKTERKHVGPRVN